MGNVCDHKVWHGWLPFSQLALGHTTWAPSSFVLAYTFQALETGSGSEFDSFIKWATLTNHSTSGVSVPLGLYKHALVIGVVRTEGTGKWCVAVIIPPFSQGRKTVWHRSLLCQVPPTLSSLTVESYSSDNACYLRRARHMPIPH